MYEASRGKLYAPRPLVPLAGTRGRGGALTIFVGRRTGDVVMPLAGSKGRGGALTPSPPTLALP